MRILAIGDIHGCSRAFERLLALIQPQPDDQIITLGDYIDRGPNSCAVIDTLLMLRKKCHLMPLRGNHEQMMLDARDGKQEQDEWFMYGGRETLASYSVLGDAGKLVVVPDEHWDFLENGCVDWHEIDTHFFVHANAYPDVPLDEQPRYMLFWESFNDPGPHMSGKIMICGHTPQKSGVPRNLGHAICLDTYAHGNGWLTCLDVAGGRIWQTNELKEHRTAWIEDYALNA